MKLLVTGGAGFIGSHFVRTVLAGGYPALAGADLTVLDKLTYAGNPENLPAGANLVVGDITDPALLRRVVPGHDAVVHFAAESHVDRSLTDPAAFVTTNVLGTQLLLDACVAAGVSRVVHVSTDEVYGSINEGAWTETWPLLPNSPYAASKAASDLIARAYWRTHGLPVSITRCSNNYGPYQHPEKLIPHFITRLLNGLPVPLYGDGRNIREWIHVDDHCRAVALVLTDGRPGEIYNVGGGTELTNRQITDALLDLCQADPTLITYVEDRKGHDLRYALNGRKLQDELGFICRVPFAEGLAATVRWYTDNEPWWRPTLPVLVPALAWP
ncbi:dTDP-glucose 4,6-dehydratase [Winogradskya consettensis]|uniref:dTDP-glucose 4,6-dehydratase n=1 Tax=Winogradskya consettensis TaxID=113560 RepID=A0A919VM78_9ACTN|nr:dTDP-glucose 4,6-dehydratase [Actinoplanes consettensis]GIM68533.1 dTDP-glucose 4,6-dehydratase [Actinoplanes consettensis]